METRCASFEVWFLTKKHYLVKIFLKVVLNYQRREMNISRSAIRRCTENQHEVAHKALQLAQRRRKRDLDKVCAAEN